MIGRFARGLGDRPVAPLAAGIILLAIGLWNGAELLTPSYPGEDDLETFTGEAADAIVVARQRGALVRFFQGRSLEFQAMLEPGERLVFYPDDMPGYEAVKDAVLARPALYDLCPDAPADEVRHRIWTIGTPEGAVVVDRAATVAGLQAVRQDAALVPGVIALFGLLLTVLAARRWRTR